MKKIAIILSFLFPAYLFCQNAGVDGINMLITKAATDTGRINLLLRKVTLLTSINADSAIVLANEIVAQSKLVGYKDGETQALASLTKLYAFKRSVSILDEPANPDSVYTAAMKAAELARKASDHVLEAYNLSLAAESLARQDRFEEAEGMGVHAIGLLDSTDASYNVYQVYAAMGSVYSMEDKYQLAIEYFEKALTKLNDTDFYKPGIATGYERLSRCYENTGMTLKALETFKLYTAITDSLKEKENLLEIAGQKLNYDSTAKWRGTHNEQDKRSAIKKAQLISLLVTLGAMLLLIIAAINAYRIKQKADILLTNQKEGIETTYDQLSTTQSRLVVSEKMASLGEVAAGIAHEIQKPLSILNGLSNVNTKLVEELKSQYSKVKTAQDVQLSNRLLDSIGQNSEKIAHHSMQADTIARKMLQHSGGVAGKKELVDINGLTDEYLRIAYHGAKAKDNNFSVTTKTNFDAGIGKINVIPQDIGKLLLNLINNAFYAVSHKTFGQETKQAVKRGYDPIVWVRTKKNGGFVEISITDNGDGIPGEITDKIFEPFFTTKPADHGTGLGLSMANDIVKVHGGEIKMETKEGEGTEFIILLPIA